MLALVLIIASMDVTAFVTDQMLRISWTATPWVCVAVGIICGIVTGAFTHSTDFGVLAATLSLLAGLVAWISTKRPIA